MNLAIVLTIMTALIVSVFAFQPESTSANSEASASSTPPRRPMLPIQSPRTDRNPAPTPSPETIQSPKPKTKQRSGARPTNRRAAKPRN
jgi:hypothetical protein